MYLQGVSSFVLKKSTGALFVPKTRCQALSRASRINRQWYNLHPEGVSANQNGKSYNRSDTCSYSQCGLCRGGDLRGLLHCSVYWNSIIVIELKHRRLEESPVSMVLATAICAASAVMKIQPHVNTGDNSVYSASQAENYQHQNCYFLKVPSGLQMSKQLPAHWCLITYSRCAFYFFAPTLKHPATRDAVCVRTKRPKLI